MLKSGTCIKKTSVCGWCANVYKHGKKKEKKKKKEERICQFYVTFSFVKIILTENTEKDNTEKGKMEKRRKKCYWKKC